MRSSRPPANGPCEGVEVKQAMKVVVFIVLVIVVFVLSMLWILP